MYLQIHQLDFLTFATNEKLGGGETFKALFW